MRAHFLMFARYNQWANDLLYAAAERLPDEAYRADRGAFFKSMHGTLNHLLVTDRIWMRRFTGEGETYDRLDVILHDNLADLGVARARENTRIIGYVDGLSDADLGGMFRYRRVSSPDEFEQPLAPALAHFFNHQTHHRGQAHAILTGFVGKAPELDLLIYQRLSGEGVGRRLA